MGGNGARSATNRAFAVGGGGVGGGGGANIFAVNAMFTQQQNQQSQPAPGAQATPPNQTLDSFRKMDDSQVVSYLAGLKNVVTPPIDELPDCDTQKLIWDIGLTGRPTIVNEATFNKINGETFYRGVQAIKDSNGVYQNTAIDVFNNTVYDTTPRFGSGVSGDGFYFGNRGTAETYAGRHIGIANRDSAIIKMKVTGSTRAVDISRLQTMFSSESSQVQRAFRNMSTVGHWSGGYYSAYALWKGYDQITRQGAGHYIVLDRSKVTVCDKAF